MAEVLGVVASAITLSIPHELQDLIEEIEIVQAVLRTLTPDMFQFLNIASTERQLLTFQRDLETIILEVQKYQISTRSRKLGAVRVVLKRKEICAQRRNLDTIKGTIQATHADTWEYWFRTPLIVIDKMWTLSAKRLTSGWNFNIRTYNVILDDALAITYCMEGNTEGLLRLFAAGLAAPNDCNHEGHSLLAWAAGSLQTETCKMLIDNGATPDTRNVDNASRYHISLPELYKLLITSSTDSVDLQEAFFVDGKWKFYSGFNGTPEALTVIQNLTFMDYRSLHLRERFDMALGINCCVPTASSMLEAAMGGPIEPEAYLMESAYGETLIIRIVQGLAAALLKERTHVDSWRHLLRDAIQALANLNQVIPVDNSRYYTPLIHFIETFAHLDNIRHKAGHDFNYALQAWITKLSDAALYQIIVRFGPTKPYEERILQLRIIKMTYGPNVQDWRIWMNNPIDEFVGEFWEMVGREEEIMPGTWVD
ncbi:hypothetical protein BJX70DRAFT_388873 [Aspergillus crustosus]